MTHPTFWRRALFALALPAAFALAAPAASAEDLPEAADILDRFVEETGGVDAYDEIQNRVANGTLTFAAAGIEGTATMYAAAPNRILMVMTMAGVGEIREGYDGTTAWDVNAMTGARIKSGAEAEQVARRSRFNPERHWRDVWKTVETVGEADVDSVACYEVRLTPETGPAETQFYSKETGYLVRSSTTMTTQMGDVPVEAYYEDYREVGGIVLPHKVTQKVSVQEVVITFESIEHNVDLPADRFAVPEEIEALMQKMPKHG